jgi:shikimate kinase
MRLMKQKSSNLVLIGMPGSGKSTVGVILAKKAMRDFIDTDVLIQTSQKRTLQEIVDTDGYVALLKIEEEQLLGLNIVNHVIATGGSAVYSHQAMTYLKSSGSVIFLDVDVATLESRVPDFTMRGLAKRPDQSLSELFEERYPLYTRYADITIKCAGLTQDGVCARIIEEIGG